MNKKKIESIYPLTQLQVTYLLHSLGAETDRCLIPVRIGLHGELDNDLLKSCWQEVTAREPVLRTSVHWENIKAPVQVVARQIQLPWVEMDWQHRTVSEDMIKRFCTEEIKNTIALNKPPVFRLFLLRCEPDVHEMIWICHHMLLDGWSGSLIVRDVLNRYDAAVAGKPLPASRAAPSFQDLVKWSINRGSSDSETFWRLRLEDLATPVSLLPRQPLADESNPSSRYIANNVSLSIAETTVLNGNLRQLKLTLSSIIQAAWAILLHTVSGSLDVVFGATVSGRQVPLEGADQIVGLLSTTLPVRIFVHAENKTHSWLQEVQQRHLTSLEHTLIDPATLHDIAGTSGTLFESMVVVENQPQLPTLENIEISHSESGIVSNAALTLIVVPGEQLTLKLSAPEILVNGYSAEVILDTLTALINFMAEHPQSTLSEAIAIARSSSGPSDSLSAPSASDEHDTVKPDTPPENQTHEPISGLERSIQDRVKTVWQLVLGKPVLAVDTSFFDMGGSSLQAIRMIEQLGFEFGANAPVALLFKYGTVTELASYFSQHSSGVYSTNADTTVNSGAKDSSSVSEHEPTLICIQPGGAMPPLYIADTTTDTLIYRHLAKHLSKDQPIHALAARRIRNRPFADLAEQLSAEIVEHCPSGPINLAGSSGGGTLAWHICQILEAQGRTVSCLILLDSYGPEFPELQTPVRRLYSVLRYCLHETLLQLRARSGSDIGGTENLSPSVDSSRKKDTQHNVSDTRTIDSQALSTPRLTDRIVRKYTSTLVKSRSARDLLRTARLERGLLAKNINMLSVLLLKFGKFSTTIALPTFLRGIQLTVDRYPHSHNSNMAGLQTPNDIESVRQSYRFMYDGLHPVTAKVVYFRATQPPPGTIYDSLSGWKPYLGENTVFHVVDGNHVNIMQEPNIRIVAARLNEDFRQKTASSHSPT